MPDKTGRKLDGTFKQGAASANPSGRPKGSRNKAILAVQALLEGEGETIARKAVELAKEGDITAIRMVLERVLPAKKDSPIIMDLPHITTAEDAVAASSAILQAVSRGEVTPNEGQTLMAMIEQLRKNIETHGLEQRIAQLEQLQENNI